MNYSIGQLSRLIPINQQRQKVFKGNKITFKQFRRNLLLKTKYKQFNNKLNKSLTFLSSPKKTQINNISRDQTSNSKFNFNSTHGSLINQNQQLGPSQFVPFENEYQTMNRRMQQYLNVVMKKVESDTDKIMKQFERKIEPFDQKQKKQTQSHNSNFMKRLKMNTLKVRLRKEKDEAKSQQQKNSDFNMTQAHNLIDKIRRTDEFLNQNRCKTGDGKKPKIKMRANSSGSYNTFFSNKQTNRKKTKTFLCQMKPQKTVNNF